MDLSRQQFPQDFSLGTSELRVNPVSGNDMEMPLVVREREDESDKRDGYFAQTQPSIHGISSTSSGPPAQFPASTVVQSTETEADPKTELISGPPFICQDCGRAYAKFVHLRTHLKKRHLKRKRPIDGALDKSQADAGDGLPSSSEANPSKLLKNGADDFSGVPPEPSEPEVLIDPTFFSEPDDESFFGSDLSFLIQSPFRAGTFYERAAELAPDGNSSSSMV